MSDEDEGDIEEERPWNLLDFDPLVLGKFGLVRFRAIFARPETRPSGP